MYKVAKKLTDYIIQKNVTEEKNRELYEYGFLVALEKLLFLVICFVISIFMNLFLNTLLFFLIFIPLRSFAGGLHFSNYKTCFFMSCLTCGVAVFTANYFCFLKIINVLLIFFMGIGIYNMYPVENINRSVDDEENNFFKKKLLYWLCVDAFSVMVCIILNKSEYLQIITNTFFVVFTTMLLGKYRISV